MKSLKPSLKEKKRYLVFELLSQNADKNVFNTIKCNCENFLGLLNASKAGIQLIKYNSKRAIFRVSHKYTDHLRSALLFQPFVLKSIGISGILKKAEARYLKGGI